MPAQDQQTDEIEEQTGQFHQSSLPLKRPCGPEDQKRDHADEGHGGFVGGRDQRLIADPVIGGELLRQTDDEAAGHCPHRLADARPGSPPQTSAGAGSSQDWDAALVFSAAKAPAIAASAAPMIQVQRTTLAVSRPETSASSGSSATARMDRPVRVMVRKKCSSTAMIAVARSPAGAAPRPGWCRTAPAAV